LNRRNMTGPSFSPLILRYRDKGERGRRKKEIEAKSGRRKER
jgi:hypothetical protein